MWLLLKFPLVNVGFLGFAACRYCKDASSLAAAAAIEAISSTTVVANES